MLSHTRTPPPPPPSLLMCARSRAPSSPFPCPTTTHTNAHTACNRYRRHVRTLLHTLPLYLTRPQHAGNLYGTTFAAVQSVTNQGQICVLDIDVQGTRSIKAASLDPSPAYIFIKPPNMEELEKRLRGRGTESEEKIQKRLANAAGELAYGSPFDRNLRSGCHWFPPCSLQSMAFLSGVHSSYRFTFVNCVQTLKVR
jgi:hypothetical protein